MRNQLIQELAEFTHPSTDTLRSLLAELNALRRDIIQDASTRLQHFLNDYPDKRYSKSACNLAHYLALRQRDLRALQERLAEAGLSSLGRSEAHVMASLERVIAVFSQMLDIPYHAAELPGPAPGFREGGEILARNTITLFGRATEQRDVRIMVTLPPEAAWDYTLVRSLLEQGMDCARINCAHDDAATWFDMVNNLRHAEAESGRRCRILMDLAGHKIRTGPVATGPAVAHIRVQRDSYGRMAAPALILLDDGDGEYHAPDKQSSGTCCHFTLPQILHRHLAVGDRLYFKDTRGKQRYFTVLRQKASGAWVAGCGHGAYISAGTALDWQRRDEGGHYRSIGTHTLCDVPDKSLDIRLHQGDRLLLARAPVQGEPARYTDEGELIGPARISCTRPGVLDALAPGQAVWIDDGKLGAMVESVTSDGALLCITRAKPQGNRLRSDKGINFPEARLNLPSLSAKDLKDLDFVCRHADMVGYSFVETLQDMERLMDELAKRDASQLAIIAKIETGRAVKNLPELMLGTIGRHPLGVMIARGDLAVELGGERLAEIQEEILWVSEAAHVPVVWATQVLETLTRKGAISRPEFTDAAMAERAECVMLNKGPYVLRALRTLDDILSRMQAHQHKKSARLRALHW